MAASISSVAGKGKRDLEDGIGLAKLAKVKYVNTHEDCEETDREIEEMFDVLKESDDP